MISTIALLLMAGGLSGCLIDDPDAQRLPDPVWVCPRPVLDATQQAKQDEADRALYESYEADGWKVVESKQTPLCAIIDCIDQNSFSADAWAQPPPPPSAEDMLLPAGVELQLTEIEVHSDLQCPYGSTAVDRPSYSGYVFKDTGAISLQDWLDNYPEVVGAPGAADRLYAGIVAGGVNNAGASTWINSYSGELENDTMSVMELLVGCKDPLDPSPESQKEILQQVGIAARRDAVNTDDQANTGDSALRIGVEFLTQGYGDGATGPGKGGWVGLKSRDFVHKADSPYGPGATIAPSRISAVGGPQYESFYQIKFEPPLDPTEVAKWWVGHNGYWLGYLKATLFGFSDRDLLTSHACEMHVYGEVADRRRNAVTRTSTDMGSGQFATKGFGQAANFRNPSLWDATGMPYLLDAVPNLVTKYIDQPPQYNPECYTCSQLLSGPAPANLFFYAGGPGAGSDAPLCK